jgi:hypothetical protein
MGQPSPLWFREERSYSICGAGRRGSFQSVIPPKCDGQTKATLSTLPDIPSTALNWAEKPACCLIEGEANFLVRLCRPPMAAILPSPNRASRITFGSSKIFNAGAFGVRVRTYESVGCSDPPQSCAALTRSAAQVLSAALSSCHLTLSKRLPVKQTDKLWQVPVTPTIAKPIIDTAIDTDSLAFAWLN